MSKVENIFTVQVRGEQEEGFFVVVTEGPFDNYEEAQEYANGILEDVKKEDPDVENITWH